MQTSVCLCYLYQSMKSPRRGKAGESREKVLAFVRQRLLEGVPPTVREVQQALGFRAVQTAQQHLGALVAEGRLAKADDGQSRGYRLTTEAPRPMLVPLLGRVQAGALTAAAEAHEGYVPVEARRSTGGSGGGGGDDRLFALRVRGDSMVGAGILAGDVVIVRRQRTANQGDIVVAMVGDEATVKRLWLYQPRGARPRLELRAENPAFAPIVIEPPDEPVLIWVVIVVGI
jgi:repressor LexA